MKKILLPALTVMIGLLIFCGASEAAIAIIGDGLWGNYTGTVSYSYNSSTSKGKLSVALNNTSSAANGGYLTAFVFNNPGNKITGVTLATDSGLGLLFGNNLIKAQPYGYYDIGAGVNTANLNNAFESGANHTNGIYAGNSNDFTFTFTGTGLSSLNEYSFVNEKSTTGGDYFLARFVAFNNGESDKVPDDHYETPEPASMALLGIGLFGLFGLKRKRV